MDWVLPPLLAPDISGNSSALATTAKPAAIKPKPRAPASPTDLGGQLPEGHVNVEGIGAASVAGAKPVLRLVGGLDISFVPATPDPAAGHMGDAAAAGPCSPPSGTSGQQGSTGGSTGGCDGSAGGASCVVEEQEEGGGGSERAVAALVVLTFPVRQGPHLWGRTVCVIDVAHWLASSRRANFSCLFAHACSDVHTRSYCQRCAACGRSAHARQRAIMQAINGYLTLP